MKINISEILSNPSVVKDFEVVPDMETLDLKRASYPVTQKAPVKLTIRKAEDKIRITGKTEIRLIIPCDRCLDDVELTFPVEIDRHVNPDIEADGIDDVDEQSFMDGCMLDVDRLVTDEVVVALPSKVLCKDDCKGLCSVCGTNLNHSNCDCDRFVPDPRMAAIQDIFHSFN